MNAELNTEELQLLDSGILPKNKPNLSADHMTRWMAGMRNAAHKLRRLEIDRFTHFLKSKGIKDIHDDLWDAAVAFSDWTSAGHEEVFFKIPCVAKFFETLHSEPIGFASLNQSPGKNWESAEKFLVARNHSHASFGWLQGPYNLCDGTIEREKGCVRKVWNFSLSGLMPEPETKSQYNEKAISENIWQLFLKGRRIK